MKKKVLSILLTLALLLSLIPAIGITAGAEVLQDVVYVDATGAAQTPVNAAKVTSGDTAWTDGWYVAEGSVTVNNTVTVTGDVKLLFGKETAGLPEWLREKYRERCIRIPMIGPVRSLNLANSVAILCYEALRQQGFPNLKATGSMLEEE